MSLQPKNKPTPPAAIAQAVYLSLQKACLRPRDRIAMLARLVRYIAEMASTNASDIMRQVTAVLELEKLDAHHLAILQQGDVKNSAEFARQLGMTTDQIYARCNTLKKAGYLTQEGTGHLPEKERKNRFFVTSEGRAIAAAIVASRGE